MKNSVQQNNYFWEAFQFLPMMRETAGVHEREYILLMAKVYCIIVLELQGHVNTQGSETLHCYGIMAPLNRGKKHFDVMLKLFLKLF